MYLLVLCEPACHMYVYVICFLDESLSVNSDETDMDESTSVSHNTNTTRYGSIPGTCIVVVKA